jgi:multidrug efflux pump subunit AcrB
MRLSHFFISRPIFAIVLSLFITIVGAVAYFVLPVAQYPEVAPPTIEPTETELLCAVRDSEISARAG